MLLASSKKELKEETVQSEEKLHSKSQQRPDEKGKTMPSDAMCTEKIPSQQGREAAPRPIKQRTEGASVGHILGQWGEVDAGAEAMPTCELQPDANPISHSEPARQAQSYGPPHPGKAFQSKEPAPNSPQRQVWAGRNSFPQQPAADESLSMQHCWDGESCRGLRHRAGVQLQHSGQMRSGCCTKWPLCSPLWLQASAWPSPTSVPRRGTVTALGLQGPPLLPTRAGQNMQQTSSSLTLLMKQSNPARSFWEHRLNSRRGIGYPQRQCLHRPDVKPQHSPRHSSVARMTLSAFPQPNSSVHLQA